jgi:hypothetical protein
MANRPEMPVPAGELTPQALCDAIRDWGASHGYTYQQQPHASEFAKVIVSDPAGGQTFTTVHNAHRGRRLRRDQVRHVVRNLNKNWGD